MDFYVLEVSLTMNLILLIKIYGLTFQYTNSTIMVLSRFCGIIFHITLFG